MNEGLCELHAFGEESAGFINEQAKYDMNVKSILSDKNILAYILKSTVSELVQLDLDTIKQCIEREVLISMQRRLSEGMSRIRYQKKDLSSMIWHLMYNY